MDIPKHLNFTESHEWILKEDEHVVTVGITDFAQQQLGDIVFIEPPVIGSHIEKGQETGVVESVKAASDVYAPISGQIIAINEELTAHPEWVNQDPYHQGWLYKIKIANQNEIESLMDAATYQSTLSE